MSTSITIASTGDATLSAGTILSNSGLAASTLVYNSPTAIPYYTNSTPSYIDFTPSTINLMENNTSQPQQVKVAVFEIERNEDQEVVSTKFVKELWLEHKPKANLTLAVAKDLAKDVDLDKIVIRELNRISF
jgi:hypothetical protein